MTATPHLLGRAKTVLPHFVPCKAADMSAGVASGGAATVVSDVPVKNVAIAVLWIDYGYRAAPTTGSIQISDGTNVWGPFTVTATGLQTRVFDPPLLFKPGDGTGTVGQVTVTLADGSATKDLYAKFAYDGSPDPYAGLT